MTLSNVNHKFGGLSVLTCLFLFVLRWRAPPVHSFSRSRGFSFFHENVDMLTQADFHGFKIIVEVPQSIVSPVFTNIYVFIVGINYYYFRASLLRVADA